MLNLSTRFMKIHISKVLNENYLFSTFSAIEEYERVLILFNYIPYFLLNMLYFILHNDTNERKAS